MDSFPLWTINCNNFVKVSEEEKDSIIREGDLFTV